MSNKLNNYIIPLALIVIITIIGLVRGGNGAVVTSAATDDEQLGITTSDDRITMVRLDDIESVELLVAMPDDVAEEDMYLCDGVETFILVRHSGGSVLFSLESARGTRHFYEELRDGLADRAA